MIQKITDCGQTAHDDYIVAGVTDDLIARITAYLAGGGLFNPELANHDAVRDLIIDCPGCRIKEPKRTPTRMLPGMKCKVCGYVDRRPSIPREE